MCLGEAPDAHLNLAPYRSLADPVPWILVAKDRIKMHGAAPNKEYQGVSRTARVGRSMVFILNLNHPKPYISESCGARGSPPQGSSTVDELEKSGRAAATGLWGSTPQDSLWTRRLFLNACKRDVQNAQLTVKQALETRSADPSYQEYGEHAGARLRQWRCSY